MSLAAAAAYETVSSEFSIDTLQAHFLSGPNPDLPLQMRVQRLSNGGRFLTRVILVEQRGTKMVHVTCSFVRTAAMKGPSMTHSTSRMTSQTIDSITLDDLEVGKNKQGPIMKFQRTPPVYTGTGIPPPSPAPDSMTYTSVAIISPSIKSSNTRVQALGIIALSDYHVLDAPPTLHGISFGLPEINDTSGTPTYQNFERYTTLNHTIHFRAHNGFKADDLCYIEVTNPWANARRAEVQSRIFDRQRKLIASCVQESYYVFKEGQGGSKL